MTNTYELPPTWLTVKLEEITLPIFTTDPKQRPDVRFTYLDISGINNQTNSIEATKSYLGKDAPSRARQVVKAGDVLFSTVRTYLKNIARVTQEFEGEVASTGFSVLRPAFGVNSNFIFYQTLTPAFLNPLADIQRGSSYPAVRDSDVKNQVVPLPPLPEQHRIVAKIEELFSELDKGIESLKTARAQLKAYRLALLKHAFEGKLTAQWRADNPDKLEPAEALLARIQQERQERYQEQLAAWQAASSTPLSERGAGGDFLPAKPKPPKTLPPLTAEELAELPELPEGWGWAKLGNLAELAGGVTKGQNLDGKEKVSLPYLRVANVQDGYLNLSEVKFIDVEKQDETKYLLEQGDVLYTEGGDKDKLGRGTVWRNQIDSCIHQNHIFRARLFNNLIRPDVLSLYSQTKTAKDYFFRRGKQTTNLASINLSVLSSLPVVVFGENEQEQVLSETELRLSVLAQLEQTISQSLQQADALRQSILKKAFSGQLVPQNPDDEPAAVLLERIRAEKAAQADATPKAVRPKRRNGTAESLTGRLDV